MPAPDTPSPALCEYWGREISRLVERPDSAARLQSFSPLDGFTQRRAELQAERQAERAEQSLAAQQSWQDTLAAEFRREAHPQALERHWQAQYEQRPRPEFHRPSESVPLEIPRDERPQLEPTLTMERIREARELLEAATGDPELAIQTPRNVRLADIRRLAGAHHAPRDQPLTALVTQRNFDALLGESRGRGYRAFQTGPAEFEVILCGRRVLVQMVDGQIRGRNADSVVTDDFVDPLPWPVDWAPAKHRSPTAPRAKPLSGKAFKSLVLGHEDFQKLAAMSPAAIKEWAAQMAARALPPQPEL